MPRAAAFGNGWGRFFSPWGKGGPHVSAGRMRGTAASTDEDGGSGPTLILRARRSTSASRRNTKAAKSWHGSVLGSTGVAASCSTLSKHGNTILCEKDLKLRALRVL
jgi:hypothetical protein